MKEVQNQYTYADTQFEMGVAAVACLCPFSSIQKPWAVTTKTSWQWFGL